jgi:hypothetical protein
MTQNHTLNTPEGSGESERRAGRGLYVAYHAVARVFQRVFQLQPSGLIARKSHKGTVLSAEKKVMLKNIIDMNIDL